MEKTALNGLQTVQYEELKALAKFCDEHDILYCLDSGTLLGAIRHGGFIPWDDDVDICMDVKNYKKFLKVAHLIPEKYYFQNFRSDPKMNVCWTKIRVNGTTITPLHIPMTDAHCGACMDIFIMNGRAKTKAGQFIQKKADQFLRALMNKEGWLVQGRTLTKGTAFLQKLPDS